MFILCGAVIAACFATSSAGAAQTPPGSSPALDPARSRTVGRWTSRFQKSGLYLDYDGVPLVKGALVQLFSGDHNQGYYTSTSGPPMVTVEALPDGGYDYTAQFHFRKEDANFNATARLSVHPDKVSFTLTARWDGPTDAAMEWNVARLWAYPLIGARYEAGTDTLATASGLIDLPPKPGGYPANSIAPPWQRMTLQLPALGVLTISTGDLDGAVLFDGREDLYLQSDKLFWLGYPEVILKPGQTVERSLTLALAPRDVVAPANVGPNVAAPMATPAVQTIAIPDAQRPAPPLTDASGDPLIIPQPKQAAFPPGDFRLTGRIPVFLDLPDDVDGRRVAAAVHTLAEDLQRDAGIAWTPAHSPWKGRGLLVTVALSAAETTPSGEKEEAPAPSRQPKATYPEAAPGALPVRGAREEAPDRERPVLPIAPPQAEGYALRITPQAVVIAGHDAAGAFYGLQTLRQLLRVGTARTAAGRPASAHPVPYFTGADVVDWPSLRFRGAHIFVGKDALPFHQKLIDRIFARYKLNALVIECEYTRWKSHPEIWVPNSMDPDALRADVAYARDHFLEPIPLINSLGHSEWIFKNGQHLELAEDVHSPHAYDASNPDTYRFIFDIYGEALEVFHPRLFHIGHDEVHVPSYDQFGKYPARPENIQKGATALFVEDSNRLADWLRARGVRTILWGDMLLHASEGSAAPGAPAMTAANAPSVAEAQQLRMLIPKDAVIADWRYGPGDEQRNGLRLFAEAGHATLACPWYQPENIRGWTQQALQNDALGLLQTTWAGYDIQESLLESEEYKQFTAYLLAAEYAWSGTTLHPRKAGAVPDPDTLPYEAPMVFARAYRAASPLTRPKPGWYLSLRRAVNISLFGQGPAALPWNAAYKEVSDHNADTLDIPLASDKFPTIGDVGLRIDGIHMGGLMLNGRLNPTTLLDPTLTTTPVAYPAAVSLPIHAKASNLAFLQATGFMVEPGTRVGTYTIVYADGQQGEIPLRYGRETRALDDSAETGYTTSALSWPGILPLTLRLLRWTNPRPDVEIARLEFRADNAYAAPILFGITGW